MSLYEKKDFLKEEIEKEKQRFTDLLPSIKPGAQKIENVLVLIDGSRRSRVAVLFAEEIRIFFKAKVDVICFHTEQETDKSTHYSYEESLAFAHDQLSTKEFSIKGEVVEDIEALQMTLEAILSSTEYDLIALPSSFIGLKRKITKEQQEEKEAQVLMMGEVFNYLLESNDIPVVILESQQLNTKQLWKHIGLVTGSIMNLSELIEKAIQFSVKGANINSILTMNRNLFEDLSDEEFSDFIQEKKDRLHKFEKANTEVFKDSKRFISFDLVSIKSIGELKKQMISFGRELGLLMIYLPSKLSSLYGLFVDLLSDPEITAPLVIRTKEIVLKTTKKPEEEKANDEVEIEKKVPKEKIVDKMEKPVEEVAPEKKDEEETIVIDDTMKEAIKEEVKKELLGTEDKEDPTKEVKEEVEPLEEVLAVREELKEKGSQGRSY
ncbi:MAG: hypothetical protein ACXABJ_10640 [Candidatus Heimdallarchaeaceae archaeon]